MAKEYWVRFGSGNPQSTTGLAPTLLVFASHSGVAITPPGITESIAGSGMYKFTYSPSFSIAFIMDGATTGLATAVRYVAGAIDPLDRLDETMGSTVLAIGATLIAQGSTIVAYGGTITQIGTNLTNQGTTLVAFGSTQTQQGTVLTNTGTTLVAIGNTSIAYGGTINAIVSGIGTTLIAEGATIVAIGNTLSALGSTIMGGFTAIDAKLGTTASSFGNTSTDPGTIYGYLKRLEEFNEGDSTFNKATGLWDIYSRGSGSSTLLREKTLTNGATIVTKS